MPGHRFSIVPGTWAVVRLDPSNPVPSWALGHAFCSVTRTPDELSIICPEDALPAGCQAEGGWALVKVLGPFPFSATGIFASFAGPLAAARISIVAMSTFDTDYLLVKQDALAEAIDVLTKAGHALA